VNPGGIYTHIQILGDGVFASFRSSCALALTGYCFTSRTYCGSQSALYGLPPTCNAYPIAILLQAYCAIYAPPPTLLVYAIHHTILVMEMSCKGQVQTGSIHIYRYSEMAFLRRFARAARRWPIAKSASLFNEKQVLLKVPCVPK